MSNIDFPMTDDGVRASSKKNRIDCSLINRLTPSTDTSDTPVVGSDVKFFQISVFIVSLASVPGSLQSIAFKEFKSNHKQTHEGMLSLSSYHKDDVFQNV